MTCSHLYPREAYFLQAGTEDSSLTVLLPVRRRAVVDASAGAAAARAAPVPESQTAASRDRLRIVGRRRRLREVRIVIVVVLATSMTSEHSRVVVGDWSSELGPRV